MPMLKTPKRCIVIFGAGVVGLATAAGFRKKGHKVFVVDIFEAALDRAKGKGFACGLAASAPWTEVDIVMLAVPTPTVNGQLCLEAIKQAAKDVGLGLRRAGKFCVVVQRSTTLPGTLNKVIKPILEKASRKKAGEDFGLCANPEFLRAAHCERDFEFPWITVIGTTEKRSHAMMHGLYRSFGALIVSCSCEEAEMVKYVNNVYNAVKISYFNEVHGISRDLGIDPDLVAATVARSAEGMWNPLYGIRGGTAYGGACLPKDTKAFSTFLSEMEIEHPLLNAAIKTNNRLTRVAG
jgi:UDPglucose 6-dehydrogenase